MCRCNIIIPLLIVIVFPARLWSTSVPITIGRERALHEDVITPTPHPFVPPPTHPMDDPDWRPPIGPTAELDINYWRASGQKLLRDQLTKSRPNVNVARNVIVVIGDGLSLATQMATRAYLGNENVQLSFEKLPYTGLAKTYCVNYQVADSSCTATAILGGVKSNYGTIGVGAKVPLRNCSAHLYTENVESIFKYAQDAGKRSGIVTTSRITHATPACAYAHSAARYWENANELLATAEDCEDIASQLVHGEVGRRLNVILGGGRRELLPRDEAGGARNDGRNVIEEWRQSKRDQGLTGVYVDNKEDFLGMDVSQVDHLMGLFQTSHMSYVLEEKSATEPSLTEMTLKALDMLQRTAAGEEGFILLVEAARIDHAHHDTLGKLALEETAEMHRMVEAMMERVNLEDTLVVVTSDHSHTMTVGGYPPRGTDILGKGDFSREDEMGFFTLNYANGMGYFKHVENEGGRRNPIGMDYHNKWFMQPATVPLDYETHGGDDVAVFAAGPHAHLFTGLYEQHYIAHAMMYAACLGRPGGGVAVGEGGEEVLKHANCPSSSDYLRGEGMNVILWGLFVYSVSSLVL